MTRRKVLFRDVKEGVCWVTPEFNGDKTELRDIKSKDSCDKDWLEIYEEFRNVKTLEEFEKANAKAQTFYHSFLMGAANQPIENIGKGRFEDSDFVIEEITE
jgi:hypothetical protein